MSATPSTPTLAQGDLAPRPGRGPFWRRGTWPLWVALAMWVLLFVRDLPGLVQALIDGDAANIGAITLLGLVLLWVAALGVAALAPGRLTRDHLGLTAPRVTDLVLWSALAIGALYGVVWLGSLVSATPPQDTDFGMGKKVASDLMFVLGIGAIGPVAEEFAYRATVFRAVTDGVSRWLSPTLAAGAGIVVSSTIFALAHTGAPLWHRLAYFAFAAVLAYGYWWTGSLYVALVPHLLNNSYISASMAMKADSAPLVVCIAVLGPLIGLGIAYALGRALPSAGDPRP